MTTNYFQLYEENRKKYSPGTIWVKRPDRYDVSYEKLEILHSSRHSSLVEIKPIEYFKGCSYYHLMQNSVHVVKKVLEYFFVPLID